MKSLLTDNVSCSHAGLRCEAHFAIQSRTDRAECSQIPGVHFNKQNVPCPHTGDWLLRKDCINKTNGVSRFIGNNTNTAILDETNKSKLSLSPILTRGKCKHVPVNREDIREETRWMCTVSFLEIAREVPNYDEATHDKGRLIISVAL